MLIQKTSPILLHHLNLSELEPVAFFCLYMSVKVRNQKKLRHPPVTINNVNPKRNISLQWMMAKCFLLLAPNSLLGGRRIHSFKNMRHINLKYLFLLNFKLRQHHNGFLYFTIGI